MMEQNDGRWRPNSEEKGYISEFVRATIQADLRLDAAIRHSEPEESRVEKNCDPEDQSPQLK
jgi:hypothetical protein